MHTNGGMNEQVMVYPMKYYSDIRKEVILPFTAKWMKLEVVIDNKASQDDKDL